MEGKNPEAKVPHRYWDDMWLTDALPTSLDFSCSADTSVAGTSSCRRGTRSTRSLLCFDRGFYVGIEGDKDEVLFGARLARAQIAVTVEDHRLRVSPSLFNDEADIDALLNALS